MIETKKSLCCATSAMAAVVVTSMLLSSGCDDTADSSQLACGAGTTQQGEECLPVLSCGEGTEQYNNECVPSSGITGLRCGTHTVQSGSECVVAETACGDDVALVEGSCQFTGASISCGEDTTEVEGECLPTINCGTDTMRVVDSCEGILSCGSDTQRVGDECQPVLSCGTDTFRSADVCVTALGCGDGTERVGDDCFGSLICGRDALEYTLEDDSDVCSYEIWADLNIDTWGEQYAREFCEGRFRCCDPEPWTGGAGGVGEGNFFSMFFLEEKTCIETMTFFYDVLLGFPDARMLAAEDPANVTIDEDMMSALISFMTADDACNITIDEDYAQFAGSEELPPLFQGNRPAGDPCMTDWTCQSPLRCLSNEDGSRCAPLRTAGQSCSEGDCADGLYCDENCMAQGGDSAMCSLDKHCLTGFWCDGVYCVALSGSMGPCSANTHCQAGLTCYEYTGGGSGSCDTIGTTPSGYQCDDDDDCGDAAYCWLDTGPDPNECRAFLAEGVECEDDGDCGPLALCFGVDDEPTVCTSTINICDLPMFETRTEVTESTEP